MSTIEIILVASFTLGLILVLFRTGSVLLHIFDGIAKNNSKRT
jgi:hypothetical protein